MSLTPPDSSLTVRYNMYVGLDAVCPEVEAGVDKGTVSKDFALSFFKTRALLKQQARKIWSVAAKVCRGGGVTAQEHRIAELVSLVDKSTQNLLKFERLSTSIRSKTQSIQEEIGDVEDSLGFTTIVKTSKANEQGIRDYLDVLRGKERRILEQSSAFFLEEPNPKECFEKQLISYLEELEQAIKGDLKFMLPETSPTSIAKTPSGL